MTSEESFVLSLPSVGRGRGRPPASSRWPFAIATEERPLKCNARRQLCPPKRLPRHAPPLQLPAAGGETALKVGGRGGSLQKLSRVFYCVVSPSFLSLLLCAPHRGSKVQARAFTHAARARAPRCCSKQHMLASVCVTPKFPDFFSDVQRGISGRRIDSFLRSVRRFSTLSSFAFP